MNDNIVLGIDPGVGSIGVFKRNLDYSKKLSEQLLDGVVLTFPSGVTIKDDTKSLASERSEKRRQRNHLLSRKQCKWATLEFLIKMNMCPLSIEELNNWRKYDKNAEFKHPYPSSNLYRSWLRCDFNDDGKPDFTMFQLRNLLAINKNLNLTLPIGKYMLGRVIYHMANHRGFRSSKGDKANINQEDRGVEENSYLKGSEDKYAQKIKSVMDDLNLPTVGCALYYLNEEKRIRIRESEYTIVAKQNKEELEYIFDLHDELGDERMKLCKMVIKTLFKVKPLGGQKGNVGYCVFEKNKKRCQKARPEYEIYRAWSFINNIRYSMDENKKIQQELTLEIKEKLFDQSFWKQLTFKFEKISNFLRKEFLNPLHLQFNYNDDLEVSGCPILFLIKSKEFLGDNWDTITIPTKYKRVSLSSKKQHQIIHTWQSIWNKCYTGDKDDIIKFCNTKINRPDWEKPILKLMNLISKSDGYSHMSTNSIRKINYFLCKGYILDKAVLLANIPNIIGQETWIDNKDLIENELSLLYEKVKQEQLVVNITNNLIASYKQICFDDNTAFAVHNYDYILDESDKYDVYSEVEGYMDVNDKCFDIVCSDVEKKYQAFFNDRKRTFVKSTSLRDELIAFLNDNFDCDASKLYNHSLIDKYTYEPDEIINDKGIRVRLLGNPNTHNLKNPVVLRTMYKLRNLLNYMLETGQITNESRLVIETAKDFNNANMRWALEQYQKIRKQENHELEKIVNDLFKDSGKIVSESDIKTARYAYEQSLLYNSSTSYDEFVIAPKNQDRAILERYKLWKEQNFKCIYTGDIISLSDVLNGTDVDIEHTLPLSKSMDDSDKNKTLCKAYFNRHIKRNRMPIQLEKEDYDKVLENIKPWKERVKFLRAKVQYWKSRARTASDKENKDYAIRIMHLYRLEYEYWNGKVSRFTMTKISNGFVHRQLSDTRTITRYLVEFLRVVFPNISVQNSNVTTAFREMLGLKNKIRDNNLHHAEDAAILSLIPSSYIRDRLLQLYYEIKETKKLLRTDDSSVNKINELNRKLIALKRIANLDCDIQHVIDVKINEILVNNITPKRVLNVTRRKYRKNGKIIPLRDCNKNIIRDENGGILPYRWHQGSCVRGELFKESFYGAIRRPVLDENNNNEKDSNGNILYEIKYVIRKSISDCNLDTIVDENIKQYIKTQKNNGIGKFVDYQGNLIRHIRCYTSNGVLPIKDYRDYPSKHVYKNKIYCENATNAFYAIYENEKGKRKYSVYNLLTVSKIEDKKNDKDKLFPLYYDNKNEYIRKYVLEMGTRVIIKESVNDCLETLELDILTKRLYVVNNIEKDGRIMMFLHLYNKIEEAKKIVKKIFNSKYKESMVDFSLHQPYLRLSLSNLNIWVEGYDFNILPDGKIKIR